MGREGSQNTMGRGVKIPWIGGQNTMGRGSIYYVYWGRYTIGRSLDIPWVGVSSAMDRGVKIP